MNDLIVFRAHAATTEVDRTRQRFTAKALAQLAAGAPSKLVTDNFDKGKPPLGHVRLAEVTDDGLMLEVELANLPLGGKGARRPPVYVVPRFMAHKVEDRKGIMTFLEVEVMDFGLTNKPSDEHIAPIEEVE